MIVNKFILVMFLLLSACASNTQIHGALVKPADVDRLRVGVNNKQQVLQILGTPSTTSTLNEEKWFYITDVKEKKVLAKPTLKERQIFGVVFNKDGILDRVFEKDEMSSKTFAPADVTTKTRGQKVGIIDQIYFNLTSGKRM